MDQSALETIIDGSDEFDGGEGKDRVKKEAVGKEKLKDS